MAAVVRLLPALYVAFLAIALYVGLARWYERVPRRVIAVHALLIAIVLGPHLALGRTLLPLSNLSGMSAFEAVDRPPDSDNKLHDDLLVQFLPTMTSVREAIARGHFPFRDDSVGGGIPLWADPQAQILQPLSILTLPLPPERAMVAAAALRMLLALTFSYLLFSAITGSVGAGLIGSIVYGLGGFMQLWLGWPHSMTAAWLPVTLYSVDRAYRSARRRDSFLIVLATFGLLTAGHPETVAYAVMFVVAFAAWRFATLPAEVRLSTLSRILVPLVLGAMLAAPVNLPALFAIDGSSRSIAFEFRQALRARSAESPPGHAQRLVSLLAPEAFGNNRYGSYSGESNINEDGSGYPGIAAWMLVLLLLVGGPPTKTNRFVLGALTCCVLIITAPPPIGWLVRSLPILASSASGGHRVLMIVALLFAWLAAEATRRLEEDRISTLRGALTALVLISVLVVVYRLTSYADVNATIASRRSLVLGAQVVGAIVVLIAVSTSRRRLLVPLLVLATAGELLVAHEPANPPARLRFPEPSRALDLVKPGTEGWLVHASPRSLRPNLGSLYGVRTLSVYNPIQPYPWYTLTAGLSYGDDESSGARGWLDALSVRYLLEPKDGPNRDGVIFSDAGNRVIERSHALPPFRFASVVARPERDSLPDLLAGPDAKKAIGTRAAALGGGLRQWLVSSPPPPGGAWVDDVSFWRDEWRPEPGDRVRIVERSPSNIRLATSASGPRLVVTTLSNDGGWRATIDDSPAEIRLVNGAFVGIDVPPGDRRVELAYRPPGLTGGLVIGLLGLMALAWWSGRFRAHEPGE